ncbi:hypothetical protein [Halochromatium roseum]|uniref:hypothetical protein n=1 Tax=Halochromatium roseum TaxID=391920 RepID=UPI0019135EAD|nr:hypothetical protein [Halochromatium roseum]MBK5939299.1 hypothetical protein [Halochromatium roseum]
MKKTVFYALTLVILPNTLGACSWAGKTTGKAVNAVEQGAAEFEQSYQQVRSSKEREQAREQAQEQNAE